MALRTLSACLLALLLAWATWVAVAALQAADNLSDLQPGTKVIVDIGGESVGEVIEKVAPDVYRLRVKIQTGDIINPALPVTSLRLAPADAVFGAQLTPPNADPAAAAPITVNSATATPGTVTSGTATSGTATATSGTATVTQGTATPGTVTPGTVTSGTVTPGTVTPGTVTSGTVTRGSVQGTVTVTPGTVTPGRVTPGTVTPGTVTQGTTPPVTISQGTVTPGTVTPGTVTPGTVTPGTATPGTASSGTVTVAPGTATSGTATPGTASSGTVTPGTVTPGTVTPGTVTPGTVTPGTVTPGTVTPGTVQEAPLVETPVGRAELRSLVGVWKVASIERNGKLVSGGSQTITITPATIVLENIVYYEVRVDPASTPRRMDLAQVRIERPTRAIYDRQADRLRICLMPGEDSVRPTEFRTTENDGRILYQCELSK